MVPVRDRGNDELFKIGQNGVKGFALLGRTGGQRVDEIAGGALRDHRVLFGVLQVTGHPIDDLVAVTPEFFRCHVSES
jgi:hypothetical protein